MASKETENLTESCSDTRSERGSKDIGRGGGWVKQKVLVSNLSIARSHLRNSIQTFRATSNYVFP